MELTICLLMFFNAVVKCQKPHFSNLGNNYTNNSYISSSNIRMEEGSLKCVTDSTDCCNDTGNWTDWRGTPVEEGTDGDTCLYVTRGDGVISLHRRNSSCIPPTSGLWRCDVSHPSGEIQSLYMYISNNISYYGKSVKFTHFFLLRSHYRTTE